MWGYVKDRIYAAEGRDLGDLRARILEAVNTMFQRNLAAIDYRIDTLRVTNGYHAELY
jgi:hypothetical protein